MQAPAIDLSALRKALGWLSEALVPWHVQPPCSVPKPHLRSAVIQSFEFVHELSLRSLRRVLPGARVAVFGSRARGCARPFSDLDLLLCDPPCLTRIERADLRDAFEASALPFPVDLVEL